LGVCNLLQWRNRSGFSPDSLTSDCDKDELAFTVFKEQNLLMQREPKTKNFLNISHCDNLQANYFVAGVKGFLQKPTSIQRAFTTDTPLQQPLVSACGETGTNVRTCRYKAERAAALIYTHFRKEFGFPIKQRNLRSNAVKNPPM
jgi:hypothetical protein